MKTASNNMDKKPDDRGKMRFDPNNRRGLLLLMDSCRILNRMAPEDRHEVTDALISYVCGDAIDESVMAYAAGLVYPSMRDQADRMEETYQKKKRAGQTPGK